jgi:hypothetical protein
MERPFPVSRILVIGGYGGFGARLCRRLSTTGHELLVAGRNYEKAAIFCSALADAEPLQLDREGDILGMLERHRPALVIDAAGPFQASGYGVPRACIAAGIPYLDLADGRDFVTGIAALDAEARAAGVAVIAGASSAPALTGAVVREVAEGLERVHSVEICLSAANHATGGASVAAAILSYVGRPVTIWRGGRWHEAHGWQEMKRESYRLSDGLAVGRRLVGLADVPDNLLLPALLPGRPSVTFRAGTELGFQMWALWLLSWPVRWGWIASLSKVRQWLLPLYRLTEGWGGERSAMSITLTGKLGERGVERRWVLVAEQGHGPEIPTLAAQLIAADVLSGHCRTGAYDAAALLSLDRFEPALAELAVRHETIETELPPPLYARVIGAGFQHLPPLLRALHAVCRDAGAGGEGKVVRGGGLLARLVAGVMRFPPDGDWPLHVGFREQGGVERWIRDFGGHRFSSELSAAGCRLVERFGPLRFHFDLPCGAHGLEMRLCRWSFLSLPLPLCLAPRVRAREWEEEGRFNFDVHVSLPLVGKIVHYSGWLRPL